MPQFEVHVNVELWVQAKDEDEASELAYEAVDSGLDFALDEALKVRTLTVDHVKQNAPRPTK